MLRRRSWRIPLNRTQTFTPSGLVAGYLTKSVVAQRKRANNSLDHRLASGYNRARGPALRECPGSTWETPKGIAEAGPLYFGFTRVASSSNSRGVKHQCRYGSNHLFA
jgi:hypothetical protein